MKKIFILLFVAFVLILCIVPVSAQVGDNRYGSNILDDSVVTDLIFKKSLNEAGVGVRSHVFSLDELLTYNFISDIGVNGVYIVPVVDGVAYGYDSLNLFGIPLFEETCVSEITNDGYYLTNSGCVYNNVDHVIPISSGVVSISVDYYHPIGYSSGRSFGFHVNYSDGTSEVVNLLGVVDSTSSIDYTSNPSKYVTSINFDTGDVPYVYLKDLCIREGNDPSYVPFYGDVFSSNSFTSFLTFKTENIYNEYALIFNSPSSGVIPDDNTMYLVRGNLSLNSIIEDSNTVAYNNGLGDGYNNGYSVGQSDGLNSSKTFLNLIMGVVSIPFTIINSTLDFDFLGLNVLNLVRVILTIMVIAWVFTRLKGRE